ncbi:MAG: SPASM domain-containing protein [Humidesulfovibrio sp.]|nr:SPASM domain-containing protein [Humidesulfovibrio sp.]
MSDVSNASLARNLRRLFVETSEMAVRINSLLRDVAYLSGAEYCPGYPAVFEVEPTTLCAMRCTHCPRPTQLDRPMMHMSPETFTRVGQEILPCAQNIYGTEGEATLSICFMHYGEPALTPHYEHGIRVFKKLGLRVISSSTSSEFSEKIAQAAVSAGLDELWLIFDGMDDETFKRMRGPRAGFEEGLACLERLQAIKRIQGAAKPAITAVMIRHPYNRHQWPLFDEFFGNWAGVQHYLGHLSTFSGRQPSLLADLASLMDDPATCREQQRVAELNAKPCRYPWHSVCVLADGRVVPCCRDINGDMVLGDLTRQSLAEIWNGPSMLALRRALAVGDRANALCNSCREASLEIGIPHAVDRTFLDQWLAQGEDGNSPEATA